MLDVGMEEVEMTIVGMLVVEVSLIMFVRIREGGKW